MSKWGSVQPAGYTIEEFMQRTSRRFADGISVSDFATTFIDLMRLAIVTLDTVPIPGEKRKQMVLAWAGDLFDSLTPRLVPSVAWPFWLMARPIARATFVAFAAGVIESLLVIVREEK